MKGKNPEVNKAELNTAYIGGPHPNLLSHETKRLDSRNMHVTESFVEDTVVVWKQDAVEFLFVIYIPLVFVGVRISTNTSRNKS